MAGINHVKLLDRSDLISMIEAFKKDDVRAVKDRIEAEPRMISRDHGVKLIVLYFMKLGRTTKLRSM